MKKFPALSPPRDFRKVENSPFQMRLSHPWDGKKKGSEVVGILAYGWASGSYYVSYSLENKGGPVQSGSITLKSEREALRVAIRVAIAIQSAPRDPLSSSEFLDIATLSHQ